MPGFMPGIHALAASLQRRGWPGQAHGCPVQVQRMDIESNQLLVAARQDREYFATAPNYAQIGRSLDALLPQPRVQAPPAAQNSESNQMRVALEASLPAGAQPIRSNRTVVGQARP